jgi:hypothetical protein
MHIGTILDIRHIGTILDIRHIGTILDIRPDFRTFKF